MFCRISTRIPRRSRSCPWSRRRRAARRNADGRPAAVRAGFGSKGSPHSRGIPMRTRLCRVVVAVSLVLPLAASFLGGLAAAAPPKASASPPVDDNRPIPVHAKICNGNIVNKQKLFFQLLGNASPAVSSQLLLSLGD